MAAGRLPRRLDACGDNPARYATLLHGVAFPRGVDTPSLQAQGGQRRPRYFNRLGDIPSDMSEVPYHDRWNVSRETCHKYRSSMHARNVATGDLGCDITDRNLHFVNQSLHPCLAPRPASHS
jgi:hypothetical protein